jgi:hypothetical protein
MFKSCWSENRQQEWRKWLRHVENLSDTEEELIHICEPETGRNLSDDEEGRSVTGLINCQEGRDEFSNCQVGNDMRSSEDILDCQEDNSGNSCFQVDHEMGSGDLINCQEGRSELSSCQVGNRRRSVEDLIDYQEGSDGSSSFQVGNEEGSLDLIDCQGGRGEIPDRQVGKGEEMNSAESSYQQGVLIDEDSCGFADHMNEDDEKLYTPIAVEEDQRCVLIVGGIQIFLPNSPAETNTRVAHEVVAQRESKKEAMGPNDFKANCVYDAGVAEER